MKHFIPQYQRHVLVFLACAMLALLTVSHLDAAANAPPKIENAQLAQAAPEFVEGELLVSFKSEIADALNRRAKVSELATGNSALDVLNAEFGVREIQALFRAPQGEKLPRRLARIFKIELGKGQDVLFAAERFAADSNVEFAEPNYLAHALITPNDPEFVQNQQWGLTKISAPAAWDRSTGSPSVTIAIIDSGMDLNHPDLAPKRWLNSGDPTINGIDEDHNGLTDDVNGWNFIGNNNNPTDDNGHGTLVAGIAGAATFNNLGIAGMCWQCPLMTVKVANAAGTANYSDMATGILYAAQKGARVINVSLGGTADSQTLHTAIQSALNLPSNPVIIAGAGNANSEALFYPAAYDEVLAVAGTDENDARVSTSNYGSWVDVSAPGQNIRTTASGNAYATSSGTSLAAPFAAGLAGLLRSQNSGWSEGLVRSHIIQTIDNIDAQNPSYIGKLGSGRINAAKALNTAPRPQLVMTNYSVNGIAQGKPNPGSNFPLKISIKNTWADASGVVGTLTTTDPLVQPNAQGQNFGTILNGKTIENPAPFTLFVHQSAGYNHVIPLKLRLTDNLGRTFDFNFNITTRSSDEPIGPVTLTTNTTWTNDKIYIVNGNIAVTNGATLTIQPGTTIKFNGNYKLWIQGKLIANGTAAQPIVFKSNTNGNWDQILFDDAAVDAVADGDGNYSSGNILRHAQMESASNGIQCINATPFLASLTTDDINCAPGATPLWLLDSTISGNMSSGNDAQILRNNIQGSLYVATAATLKQNTLTNGSLNSGDNSTIQNNTVNNGGISVGDGSVVQSNNVQNSGGVGIAASGNVTLTANRVVGNATGISANGGTIQNNLIANNIGVGLQLNGTATVSNNTFTGNQGNAIVVNNGAPTLNNNNLERNKGQYEIENESSQNINAQANWWGTTNANTITSRIYDFNDGNPSLGQVDFSSALTNPAQTAPAYVRNVTTNPASPVGLENVTFDVQFSRAMNVSIYPILTLHGFPELEWKSKTSMPTARMALAVTAGTNGKIYAIGGWNGSYLATVEEYNPTTDTWTTKASMPTPRADLGVTTANGKIYAIGGGINGPHYGIVEEYDPSTNTWTRRANMPTAREFLAVTTGANGKIYAIGGVTNSGTVSTVEEYDPMTDTWAARASMPTSRSSLGVTTGANGKIYAIGGSGGNLAVEEYDPTTNAWTTRANMLTPRERLAVITGANGRIYAMGGWGSSVVEEYDPTINTWTTRANMLTARCCLGAAIAANGKIYAIGGRSGSFEATVEEGSIALETDTLSNKQWVNSVQYHANFSITSLVPKGSYTIIISDAIGTDGIEIAPSSDFTFQVDYAGTITDQTPPKQPKVTDDGAGTTSLTQLHAKWSSSDKESPITQYQYAIGTSPNATDVVNWTTPNPGTATEVTHTGLNLNAGQAYYFSVRAQNEGGLWSEGGTTDGILADPNFVQLAKAKLKKPTNGATVTKSKVKLDWNDVVGATQNNVIVKVDSSKGKTVLQKQLTLSNVKTPTLQKGKTYYWRAQACTQYGCGAWSKWWSFKVQ